MKLISLFAVAATSVEGFTSPAPATSAKKSKGDINLEKEPAILMGELVNRYHLFFEEQFSDQTWAERGIKFLKKKLRYQSEKILDRFENTNKYCEHWPVSEESDADGAVFAADRYYILLLLFF